MYQASINPAGGQHCYTQDNIGELAHCGIGQTCFEIILGKRNY